MEPPERKYLIVYTSKKLPVIVGDKRNLQEIAEVTRNLKFWTDSPTVGSSSIRLDSVIHQRLGFKRSETRGKTRHSRKHLSIADIQGGIRNDFLNIGIIVVSAQAVKTHNVSATLRSGLCR
jgi:hypothetical protein